MRRGLIMLALLAIGADDAVAQTAPTASARLTVLSKFTDRIGNSPKGTLARNSTGALFGTAFAGGRSNLGTVFMVTPPTTGRRWTTTVLRAFDGGLNGSRPAGALTFGPRGVLYGAAQLGGGADNDGTLFQLTPPPTGKTVWSFKTIHRFTGGNGGSNPFAGVVRGSDGSLYGTTFQGGPTGWGTVFRLTPPAAGAVRWSYKPLYYFGGTPDAGSPQASLTIGPDGALYGTTKLGGAANLGTVFKLSPPAEGRLRWTETILHEFAGASSDGAGPLSGVTFDSDGNLYGTASFGGSEADAGAIFRLTPPPVGRRRWAYDILHTFTRTDGASPQGDLVVATDGTLYGTTAFGSDNNSGVVFKLVPPKRPRAAWLKQDLHVFSGTTEGAFPVGGLVRAANGQLFGAASGGGPSDDGTIYRIIE